MDNDREQVIDSTFEFHLSPDGYLRLDRDVARQHFPEDTLLALWRDESLVLLPTRGSAAGGLLLKQRNRNGDRSVLLAEIFQFEIPSGYFQAKWDSQIGGFRVSLGPSLGVSDLRGT